MLRADENGPAAGRRFEPRLRRRDVVERRGEHLLRILQMLEQLLAVVVSEWAGGNGYGADDAGEQ
jgi:hypothetical protein